MESRSGTGESQKTVRIIFDGVVAVGPTPPEQERNGRSEADGHLFAVMPMATRRRDPSKCAPDLPELPLHLPVIFTRALSCGRPPDERYKGYNIWHVMRERMEVVIDGNSAPGVITYLRADDQSGNKIDSIPFMRCIWPERRRLHSHALEVDAPADCVAAQFFAPSGTLGSGDVFGEGYDHVKFRPVKTGGVEYAPHVLPQIMLTVPVENIFEIRLWSLATGEPLESLTFKVTSPMDLWVANMDVPSIHAVIDRLNGHKPCVPSRRYEAQCDADFGFFYSVVVGNPNDVSLPCGDRGGERRCYSVMVDAPRSTLLSTIARWFRRAWGRR